MQNYIQYYYHFNSSHLEIKDITKMKKQIKNINTSSDVLKILDKVKLSPSKLVVDEIIKFAKSV